jgi:hypothetical protein
MASVVKSRRRAAELIRADYPEPERTRALAALGDAAAAKDGPDLFARRCNEACLAEFERGIGAPMNDVPEPAPGDIAIETTKGGRFTLHRGEDGAFGIVWNTPQLRRSAPARPGS